MKEAANLKRMTTRAPMQKPAQHTTPQHPQTQHHDFAWRAFLFCKKHQPKL